jgi:hypothetical protein
MNTRDKQLPFVLFFLLLLVFFFFYSGVPGTDDEQLFASAAQSFSITGKFSAFQVYGNERIQGYYSNIAPLHPWIGSLVYNFAEQLQTGGLQCFFLLSPFYTALTGFLLIKIAQKRGYSPKTIVVSILAFGFTTMVFAYSKTFFREPLAMLLISVSYYALDDAVSEKLDNKQKSVRLLISFLFLVLAVWTKEFLIVCVPLMIIYFFQRQKGLHSSDSNPPKASLLNIYFLLIPLGLLLVFLGVLMEDRSGRFSISFFKWLLAYLPSLKHDQFIRAFCGAFFSLFKGFIIYSPIFLLAGFFPFLKNGSKEKLDWLMAIGSAVGVASLQAFFYDSEWWTFTWSSRFMLPIIPFWLIGLFPIMEWILGQKRKWIKSGLILLLTIGFIFQLGAVLISDADYTQFLWDHYHYRLSETNVSHIEAIPAIGHWLALFHGITVDVAWVRIFLSYNSSVLWIPIIMLIIGAYLIFMRRHYSRISKRSLLLIISPIVIFSILLPLIVLVSYRDDPYFARNQLAYGELLNSLSKDLGKKDLLVVDAYNQPLWYFYFNFGFPHSNWLSLPPPHLTMNSKIAIYPELEETISFLSKLKVSFDKIWLITEKKEIPEEINYPEALQQSGMKIKSEMTFYRFGQLPLVKLIEFSW